MTFHFTTFKNVIDIFQNEPDEEEFAHVLPINFVDKRPYLAEEDFEILRDCPSEARNIINGAFFLQDDLHDTRPAFEAYTHGRIPG